MATPSPRLEKRRMSCSIRAESCAALGRDVKANAAAEAQ
jgi:hypothetical protein